MKAFDLRFPYGDFSFHPLKILASVRRKTGDSIAVCIEGENPMLCLYLDQICRSWRRRGRIRMWQWSRVKSCVIYFSFIHGASRANACSISLFRGRGACSEHCLIHEVFTRSQIRCIPADNSQVVLMQHFHRCHSAGLFPWLLLRMARCGENHEEGARILVEWTIQITVLCPAAWELSHLKWKAHTLPGEKCNYIVTTQEILHF